MCTHVTLQGLAKLIRHALLGLSSCERCAGACEGVWARQHGSKSKSRPAAHAQVQTLPSRHTFSMQHGSQSECSPAACTQVQTLPNWHPFSMQHYRVSLATVEH